MKEVYIVKAEIDCDRNNVEIIEGNSYPTTEDFYNDETVVEMEKRGKVLIEKLSDFTRNWNDTDDMSDYLNIYEYFIGYVFIGK